MNHDRQKVAAIVAAYNEEKTISDVVRTLVASKRFADIVVISDGSTDKTAALARSAGATTVRELSIKNGKGAALMHGVKLTNAPCLFFCDADLYGFETKHVNAVIDPVLEEKLTMCVGLRDRGSFLMWLTSHLPLIGGERTLRRTVFEGVPDTFLSGFMVEIALNYFCRSRGLAYGSKEMPGVHIRTKFQKVGFVRGLKEYCKMWIQIFCGMLIVRFARFKGEF